MTIAEIMDNFALLESWEEKYQYLIELGQNLPPMDEQDKNDTTKVSGCMSQVWIKWRKEGDKYYFTADSDAFIVRGLEAVLLACINGKTAKEILQTPFEEIFGQLGLMEHLSPTRRNGFFSMIQRIHEAVNEK